MPGICVGDQCLSHAAQPMHDRCTLLEYAVRDGSTIRLNGRLRGGTTGWQLIMRPRIQKDRWSNYWKVSHISVPHAPSYWQPRIVGTIRHVRAVD